MSDKQYQSSRAQVVNWFDWSHIYQSRYSRTMVPEEVSLAWVACINNKKDICDIWNAMTKKHEKVNEKDGSDVMGHDLYACHCVLVQRSAVQLFTELCRAATVFWR